jgi:hypothetical protein
MDECWQSTQIPLNLNYLILYERNILQQFYKPSLIFIYGHTPKLEFKKIFHFLVIVSISQVFILKILLKLSSSNTFLFNVLHLHKLIPPHGCISLELIHVNSSFCMKRIIMQLNIFSHAQQPCLCIFILLVLTIKCRRFYFSHLSS